MRLKHIGSKSIRCEDENGTQYLIDDSENPETVRHIGISRELNEFIFARSLGINLVTGDMHAAFVRNVDENEVDEAEYLLINYVIGNSSEDINKNISLKNPYSSLSKHLEYLKGERLDKTFDYIYHFGTVTGKDEIALFTPRTAWEAIFICVTIRTHCNHKKHGC